MSVFDSGFDLGRIEEETLTFSDDWAAVLDQDEYWVDASGTRLDLDEMDVDHCINVARWILRALPRLAERDTWRMAMGPGPTGDVACDSFDREMDQLERIVTDPAAWADEMPLMKALKRRARGLSAREEEKPVTVGGKTYRRRPQEVLAIRYDGTNADAVRDCMNSPLIRVEETMISGPGRGMQKALSVWAVNFSAAVPVGGWLLHDEDDENRFWSMTDEEFAIDYEEKF